MHTTNLFRNFALVVIIAGFTAVLTSFAAPPAPTERNADKVRSDLNRLRDIGPQGGRLSTSERDELERIKDHLRSSDPNEVVSGIAEGIRSGKLNREVPAYRQILPELPAVKQEVLRRIAAESDPVVKGGLINCVLRVPGADVIRTLIHQL